MRVVDVLLCVVQTRLFSGRWVIALLMRTLLPAGLGCAPLHALAEAPAIEVAFVDAGVSDASRLVEDLRHQREPHRRLEVHLLNADGDGISQIASVLEQHDHDVAAIHLLGHGTDGAIRLGSVLVDQAAWIHYKRELALWRRSLKPDGDILLYGCNVAATGKGRAFVKGLAAATDARVAASSDATGSWQNGGNWLLEFSTAPVRADIVANAATQADWSGKLSIMASGGETTVHTVTTGAQTTTTQRQVGVDASGNYVTVWQSGTSIMGRVLSATGANVVLDFTVATGTLPQVAMNASGQFVVVWKASGGGISAQRYNAAGTTSGSQITVSSSATAANPSIAMNNSGNVVISWSRHYNDTVSNQYRELHAAIYSWAGTIKSDWIVSDKNANCSDGDTDDIVSSVAINASGKIALVADHGDVHSNNGSYACGLSRQDIWLWTFDASGNLNTDYTSINPVHYFYRDRPSVAMDDSGNIAAVWRYFNYTPYTVWCTPGEIYSAQATWSSGSSVNLVAQIVGDGSCTSPYASVTMNQATGVYSVVYQSSTAGTNDIYIRQFAVDGTSLLSQTRVNSTVAGAQTLPSVARNGIYMALVWSDPANSGDVVSQRYVDLGPHHFEVSSSSASVNSGSTITLTIKACANAASPCTVYTDGVSGVLSITGTNFTSNSPSFSIASGLAGGSTTTVSASFTATPPPTTATIALSSSTPSPTATPALWCGLGVTPASGTSCSMAVVGVHHLNVTTSSASVLTCANPVTFTIAACADASCATPYTSGGISGNLSLTGTATVNYPSGSGFSIGSGGSSTTVQAYITTSGILTVGLSGVSPTMAASPGTYCGLGTTASSIGSCSLTAASSGLLFTVPNHVSDVSQSVTVSAVRASDSATVCTPAFASATKSVNFKCGYSNPATGSLPVRVGGTALNASANALAACDGNGRSVSLSFNASGVASTTVAYADVGQTTLTGTYTGSGADAGLSMTGSSTFIVAPASFVFSGYPASASATTRAGSPFSATLTAKNSSGNAVPNFGRELIAESATLSWSKATPTGPAASSGVFSRTSVSMVLGGFSNGGATASDLIWNEVGTGDLSASLSSGSYLSSGLTVSGTTGTGGAVGRFIPHHFDTSVTQACGSFSYSGQPFTVAVTALNAFNGITVNYNGTANTTPTYAKPVTLSANSGLGSLSGSSLGSGSFNAGTSASSPASPSFAFGSKLTPPASITITAVDSDGVSSASGSQGAVVLRSGRLRVSNGYGSKGVILSLPVQAQYWNGRVWVVNSLDSCTFVPAASVALSNYVDSKGAAATWTTSPSSVSLIAGNGQLTLSAPSGNASGSVDFALNLGSTSTDASCLAGHPATVGASQSWLRARSGSANACAGDTVNSARDPSAKASFGIYSAESRKLIFMRDFY